jgi:hypothetical protein
VSEERGTTALSTGASGTGGETGAGGAGGASTLVAFFVALGVLVAADILYIVNRVLFIFIFGLNYLF